MIIDHRSADVLFIFGVQRFSVSTCGKPVLMCNWSWFPASGCAVWCHRWCCQREAGLWDARPVYCCEWVSPASFLTCPSLCVSKLAYPLIVRLYIRNGTQRRWVQEVFGSCPAEYDPADNWAGISLRHTNTIIHNDSVKQLKLIISS